MVIALLPVYAETFNVISNVKQNPNTQNRVATIALSYTGGSTKSIEGTIDFDSDFFESVSVENSESWSVRHTGSRFVTTTTETTAESGQFAIITARVKSDTTLTEGEIRLSELESGTTGECSNKTIKVTMESPTPVEPSEPAQPEAPASEDLDIIIDTDTNSGNSEVTPAATTKKSETKTATLSNVKNLPKAGIVSGIGLAILAGIIVATVEFVKYKKINK